MVSVTTPIHDDSGAFVGVAGADILLNQLADLLDDYSTKTRGSDIGFTCLIDKRGTAPAGSPQVKRNTGEEKTLAFALPHAKRLELGFRPLSDDEKGKDAAIDARRMPGQAQLLAEGDVPEGVVVQTPLGRHILYTKLVPGTTWKLALYVPRSSISGQVWRTALLSFAIGLAGLALMLNLVTRVADRVTEPIDRLTTASSRVEIGDYELSELEPIAARHDDLGQLARGFRRMVQEVASREKQLREAQADLERSERHFRALIENATDIVSIVDAQAIVRYNSPSFRQILGYAPDQHVDRPATENIHPEDRDRVATGLRDLVTAGGEQMIEYRFRARDGSWRTLESHSTNLLADPAVAGIVINTRDVTDRRRAEDEVRRLNARLELRVRERTAELETALEQLRAAKEATEQAMRQQEVFLSNVAHDLRTPLTVVIGYGEDLLRRARKKGIDAFVPDLQLVVNRGRDLLELINDLLSLSKAMNDRGIDLDIEVFDVVALVRERIEGLGPIAKKYGNTIVFEPVEGLGNMVADRSKVWRILMNLLSNACKFTKDGRITVSAERESSPEGERIVFRVSDTGMGIPVDKQAILFHRFARAHPDSGRFQAGVGLGLSICLLYCRAMGGEIRVASEEGKGSMFTVSLPAIVATAPQPSQPAPDRPTRPPAPATPVRRATGEANLVLIIDDDTSVTDLVQRNLAEEGIASRAATSGEEGLRLAKQILPSAIILDVVMPGLDGWGVLAALKADAATAEIPIIMASMLDERERGLRLGADEYVTKPLARDRLVRALHKHLRDRPTPRILVVEDDDDTRRLLAGVLREQDWIVQEASDGAEALSLIASDPPDLVVLDLMLPTVDGFEVVERLRRDPRLPEIPILVVTAAELSADDRRRLEGRVAQVLGKDLLDRDELLREIRALVAEYARTRTPVPAKEEVHG
jgi:PAS domain S-box-containing protein